MSPFGVVRSCPDLSGVAQSCMVGKELGSPNKGDICQVHEETWIACTRGGVLKLRVHVWDNFM